MAATASKNGGLFSRAAFAQYVCVMTPGLRSLSAAELLERLTETEVNIRRFSEELVQQLAVRDELDFEKEVKNSFISALIDVQNRQKEHRESLRKKKKLKGGAGAAQGLPERTPGSVNNLTNHSDSRTLLFCWGKHTFLYFLNTLFDSTFFFPFVSSSLFFLPP